MSGYPFAGCYTTQIFISSTTILHSNLLLTSKITAKIICSIEYRCHNSVLPRTFICFIYEITRTFQYATDIILSYYLQIKQSLKENVANNISYNPQSSTLSNSYLLLIAIYTVFLVKY